ncbi:hypothetical protein FA95DRAFT_1202766 [Auriscalpium vulgare]|uniref:Uncharacterized protein n=1 Tax=Auriscalpium vulgare TaxID=40419 RepID=A0ACB8RTL4_9AGAM|nr:hypothetical protein FA95DRAFT_1202766 [Auriscalpium vulgare]
MISCEFMLHFASGSEGRLSTNSIDLFIDVKLKKRKISCTETAAEDPVSSVMHLRPLVQLGDGHQEFTALPCYVTAPKGTERWTACEFLDKAYPATLVCSRRVLWVLISKYHKISCPQSHKDQERCQIERPTAVSAGAHATRLPRTLALSPVDFVRSSRTLDNGSLPHLSSHG